MPLTAISDDGNFPSLDNAQIGVVVVKDFRCHNTSFFLISLARVPSIATGVPLPLRQRRPRHNFLTPGVAGSVLSRSCGPLSTF
jgi:hypothetical protein